MRFKKASLVLAAALIASMGTSSFAYAADDTQQSYTASAAVEHAFGADSIAAGTVVLKNPQYGDKYVATSATENDWINSPSASSNIVSVDVYSADGTTKLETIETTNNGVLTMVKYGQEANSAVDILDYVESGEQLNVTAFTFYETAGSEAYSEMAKFGNMAGQTAQYTYRSALKVDDGEVDETESISALIADSQITSEQDGTITVNGIMNLDTAFMNGIIADDSSSEDGTDTKVAIDDATLTANGDGANDFQGEAATVLAAGSSEVDITDSTIFTEGVIRTAAAAKENGILKIDDSVLYTEETDDTTAEYNALVVPMMKRTPFALGIEGVVRATNILGSGQGIYTDSLIASSGWGVLSTDSGTSYSQTGTYALDVSNVIAGIGTVEAADNDKSYTATKEVNGTTYGFTQGGSGYVAYADSGVWDKFDDVQFYSDDYVQIMASSTSSAYYTDSILNAGRIAVMTQQNAGGTISIKDSTVNAGDTAVQVKSGAANAGYTNVVLDNATVNYTGSNNYGGTLVELVESDDAGNPGTTSYTINDTGDKATSGATAIAGDTNVTLTGSKAYTGNVWNNIYNNSEALNLTIENGSSLTGTISSSYGYHVDENGDRVANGTTITCNTEGDYRTSTTETGEYEMIGSLYNVANEQINNPVNVTLESGSSWTVDLADGTNGEANACYLNNVSVAANASITSENDVTIYYYGTLDIADGANIGDNITFVKSTVKESEQEDDGIALTTQFYDGTPLEFYVEDTNGNPVSSAVSIEGQAFTTYKFNITAADGYTIESINVPDGVTMTELTSGNYKYELTNSETSSQTKRVTVIVKADSQEDTALQEQTISIGNKAAQDGNVTLKSGKSLSLNASAKGALTYTSSDNSVATVSSKGVITAKKAGTATITVKAAATSAYAQATKTIKVTVKKATNTITVKSKKVTVKAGKSAKLKVSAIKGSVKATKVKGNKKIKVSSKGKISVKKSLKKGTYTVKVKLTSKAYSGTYTSQSKTISVKVKVK
ncbi:Ig-like domain-containing protein [Eubacterium oxidoreducens]|uniref:Ig-like domain (Group 2) n=1 Tax=Eubacterium oxidoreducens TaxID=1732 RepID=A0A1G6C830_EUBOX|nr:Ig-like domain-containing protein [Eubacterium oxidoreducens]SDB29046.1 Ig-like domain (group 2) [Eubacterium oxidoreducens]